VVKLINTKKILVSILQLARLLLLLAAACSIYVQSFSQAANRQEISLNDNWLTVASKTDSLVEADRHLPDEHQHWQKVNLPHNWDAYEGYRRLLHGNRHGNAWYKKTFSVKQTRQQKRFFLFFEGVGSYAYVLVNGKAVGEHAGGRTTFTIDITDVIKTDGSNNYLAVRAWHPSGIKDLPWVCGGCSDERGFSEGSQPMGIFRPVRLVITNDIRVEPFGIHAWADVKNGNASLSINTTFKNYSLVSRSLSIVSQLVDHSGKIIAEKTERKTIAPVSSSIVSYKDILVTRPMLWSIENPYLYKVVTLIKENDKTIDRAETDFGFRSINWKNNTHQFFLNDKPVFINGVAEYEHLIGQSHAFSKEQVLSRINWIKAAGFNAFRDGHQPHNLLYGKFFNKEGILWWTQLSAHVWYDSPEFRENFKKLLKEWVIERRNDPSVILWGLQNESKLPEDFARECTQLIRELDPTTSSQRLVTTCNGGSGTDWDVPQNWTGTYGGDPETYSADIKKQVLIGEYGAWRTIDLHTEGPFIQNGILSEDRMTQLMEKKVKLAEAAKDSSAGHFFWLLTSHDNPGRVQGGEGWRELDRVGPVNYKGLLTPWEEPLDVYYMFRSNYASKLRSPMVYIVSHTWPGRWTTAGIKDSITVYSNCDEVELYNDINNHSLGKRKRNGTGTHFQWDEVMINYNVLYAVGYVNGKAVARDTIVLHHLPKAPGFKSLYAGAKPILKPAPGYKYIYRINCGGPDYRDEYGNDWLPDKPLKANELNTWGSVSWTNDFPGMPSFFASQRRTFDAVKGAKDWKLFQDFRYGRDKLQYVFPLPDGEYLVELYFIEPWLGIGGGIDATNMRLFDVAINNKTVLQALDIWREAGTNRALKKTIKAKITGGKMTLSFPNTKVGQALISAIAIASLNKNIEPAPSSSLISLFAPGLRASCWLDIGDKLFTIGNGSFRALPPALFGADWLKYDSEKGSKNVSFKVNEDADVFVGIEINNKILPAWLKDYENTQTQIETDKNGGTLYQVYRKRFSAKKNVALTAESGSLIDFPIIILPVTTMQPAYDLKKLTSYRTDVAILSAGVKKEMFGGREAAIVNSNGPVTIEWPVQTGVADIYSVNLKYYYANNTPIKGRVQLIGAGNTMMLEEPVSFTFTRPGKWNIITFNTNTMINAGNYTVRLIVEGGEGLTVSGIEVQ
jgi:hypothetical protein